MHVDTPIPPRAAVATLQPRYRRVLTFGDVLDESIQLYRQHWTTFALVSAVSLIPPGLLMVWASASGLFGAPVSLADIQSGRLPETPDAQVVAVLGTSIMTGLFSILFSAATIATTDAFMRGQQPPLAEVYGLAVRRFFIVLLAGILFFLGLAVLTAIATLFFVVTLFGTLGSIVALVALLFWWLRPGARKAWVKWLIILAAPFGLPVYFSVNWSMFAVAAIVERHGPVNSIVRSGELTDCQWFRVASILAVGSLIVGVLLYAPAALVDIPLTVSGAARGQIGLDPTQRAISEAVSLVLQILFASVGSIIYTVLYVDLRNRREATDIVERLAQLED